MKKLYILAILFLLFSCSEDDGEKNYNYLPNKDQYFKFYKYKESLILDVNYTYWNLDLRTQNLIEKK